MKSEFHSRLNHIENKQHLIDEITEIFTPYGVVKNIQLIVGRDTSTPKATCCIAMESVQDAHAANAALNVNLFGFQNLVFSFDLNRNFATDDLYEGVLWSTMSLPPKEPRAI